MKGKEKLPFTAAGPLLFSHIGLEPPCTNTVKPQNLAEGADEHLGKL